MPLMKQMLYVVVAVTVTSLPFCNGKTLDSEASAPGSVQLRSVTHESVAPTRHGSLTFNFTGQGAHKSPHVFHNLMDAKLKNFDPSVQCSDTSMTLKVKRVRAPHFLVDSGEGPHLPFSQMPSKCGFLVKRSRRDVHFAAPYHGCHVTQQGGKYVLPLRLWGAPVTMSCPAEPLLPPPSVACFPSGMVVNIGGIAANELKVKVSDMWRSLSSVCDSCGFAIEVLSAGLKLTVPYNSGPCVKIEGEKYLLSLLVADVELLVTCPSLPEKPASTTTSPPSDGGQYPQYPWLPVFPKYPVFPGPTPSTYIAAPTTGTAAPLPQNAQLPSGPADTENQEAPAYQHPSFPLMPQYPQFPQYPLFLRPIPPTHPTPNKNTAAPPGQFLQMQHSPQYQFSFYPQFPMVPGIFHPTTPPSTRPAPTTKQYGKPHVPQQSYFPLLPTDPFLPVPELPLSQEDQTQSFQDHKPVIPMPNPYSMYPHTYQIPVLYPPLKSLFQRRNTQIAAPATTAATTPKPADQKSIYYPHLYMPSYYVPQQAPMLLIPDPPSMPPANPAPFNRHEQQHVYHAMPPFYPSPSHQRPQLSTKD